MTIFRFLNNEDVDDDVYWLLRTLTVSSHSLSFILDNSLLLSLSLSLSLLARPTFYERSETSRPERNTHTSERGKRATTRLCGEERKASS